MQSIIRLATTMVVITLGTAQVALRCGAAHEYVVFVVFVVFAIVAPFAIFAALFAALFAAFTVSLAAVTAATTTTTITVAAVALVVALAAAVVAVAEDQRVSYGEAVVVYGVEAATIAASLVWVTSWVGIGMGIGGIAALGILYLLLVQEFDAPVW